MIYDWNLQFNKTKRCKSERLHHLHYMTYIQWLRNKFETGGHRSGVKVGDTDPAQSAVKNFFVRAFPLFGSKNTISRFGERFRDGQYSFVSFLFAVLLLTVPRAQTVVG